MSRKRRNHSPEFKAKVALAAIKGNETVSELSRRYEISGNLIVKWKKQLLEKSAEVFASGTGLAPDREAEIKDLQAKIGEITMVNDCRRLYRKRSVADKTGAQEDDRSQTQAVFGQTVRTSRRFQSHPSLENSGIFFIVSL